VIAGDAWAQCRAGQADPSTFGIFKTPGVTHLRWEQATINRYPGAVHIAAIPSPDAHLRTRSSRYWKRVAQESTR
jgi:hypothetical protein